jgi:hypothetical protein
MIKAKYKVGNNEKIALIAAQSFKATDLAQRLVVNRQLLQHLLTAASNKQQQSSTFSSSNYNEQNTIRLILKPWNASTSRTGDCNSTCTSKPRTFLPLLVCHGAILLYLGHYKSIEVLHYFSNRPMLK